MALKNPVYDDFTRGLRTNGEPDKLDLSESPGMQNALVTPKGSTIQRAGCSKLMDQSAAMAGKKITMLTNFQKSDGTKEVLVAYGGLVKRLNLTSGVVTDLPTPVSGHNATLRYGAAVNDDKLYFCNGTDSMVEYTGSANTNVTLTNIASTTFKTNIFAIRDRKMFAVDAATPKLLHRSRTGAVTTFNYAGGSVVENSGTTSVDEGGTPVTALSATDNLYVYTKNRVFNPTYSDLSGSTVFLLDEVMRGVGAITDASTIEVGNLMIFFDPVDESVQQIGYKENFPTIHLSGMSDAIRNLVQDVYDFSDAAAIHWKRKFLISCKSSSSAGSNDTVLLFDLESKSVFPITNWYVNCWMEYDGDLYFGSSLGPFVYKAFDGMDDDGGIIPFNWDSRIESFGDPAVYKNVHMLFVEGTITELAKLQVTCVFDWGRDSISKVIDGNNSDYIISSGLVGYLGETTVGTYSLGGIAQEADRIFQVGLRFNVKKFQNVQVKFEQVGDIGTVSIKDFYFIDPVIDTTKLPSNRII